MDGHLLLVGMVRAMVGHTRLLVGAGYAAEESIVPGRWYGSLTLLGLVFRWLEGRLEEGVEGG